MYFVTCDTQIKQSVIQHLFIFLQIDHVQVVAGEMSGVAPISVNDDG